ncbi:MAG: transposase [Elusimicrobia bacterium]|nr:transposase [Elusimicrobiota bacterium]
MARGVDRRAIFIDRHDYEAFLRLFHRIMEESGATVFAYCLMPNHFHLAIKVGSVPLSSIMQRILTSYAITFNRRHDRTGHLFEARHKAKLCLDDRYLLGLIRYIQMNPVRAGLVSNAADWPWSSRSPVELPNLDADGFDPWPKDDSGPTLLRPEPPAEATLQELGEQVASSTGVGLGAMRSRSKSREIVSARIRMTRESVLRGHRLSAIANWLNAPLRSVSYYLTTNVSNC